MLLILHERNRRLADLLEVKGADRARHTDGDARIRVDQNRREGNRKQRRLLELAVVIIDEINRILVDIAEQLVADRVELCLCVTGGGPLHIAGIRLTEIALGIDIRVQERLIPAGEADHGIVDRCIAVRVELHRAADDIGRFGPGTGQKPHLIHRV